MRVISTLLVSTILVASAAAQSLYKVDLDDRIDRAELIVEGRVVDQRTFWNYTGTLIYTASTIERYRVFKGEASGGSLEIITPGGTIGLYANVVSPSLSLRSGDVGVLFLNRDEVTLGRPTFKPYASLQGFIRYDESAGTAADVFDGYANIRSEVYGRIEGRLDQKAVVVQDYATPDPRSAAVSKGAPIVTSVSPDPTTAGTGTEITISGLGFEPFDGGTNSAVFFPNADTGGKTLRGAGGDRINSWTETEIKVKVPTGAGTGLVTVQSASQQTGASSGDLTIDYNRIEVSFNDLPWTPDLRDKNGAGGYSLAMSTNTSDNGVNFVTSPGVAPFESALTTWQGGTGFNMRNNGGVTASNTVDPGADPDIIMFDNSREPLEAGILGRAHAGYSGCNGGTIWWMTGVDIVFRRDGTDGITWHFGPGAPPFRSYDFESVSVHELGHAHQLGHIIAPDKVMHYAIQNGEEVRTLDPISDIAGGLNILTNVGDLGVCGQSPMTPLVGVAVNDDVLPDGLSIIDAYPNPFTEKTQILVESVPTDQRLNARLYDVLGREVRTLFEGDVRAGKELGIDIDGADLIPGVYLVRIEGEGFSTTRLVMRVRG